MYVYLHWWMLLVLQNLGSRTVTNGISADSGWVTVCGIAPVLFCANKRVMQLYNLLLLGSA